MKKLIILTLLTQPVWAKQIVVVAHFDPFGKSKTNNSKVVAKELAQIFKKDSSIELKVCELSTSYDRAYGQLEACVRSLPSTPKLILGIGETGCKLKFETMGRNLDHSYGPDNDGTEIDNQSIKSSGPYAIGLSAPLAHMYCALDPKEQKSLDVSNNAGSFVCNNIIYQYAYNYPDENFSFIHVPESSCKRVIAQNKINSPKIAKMIRAGVKSTTLGPIPTTQNELNQFRNKLVNTCHKSFYERIKGSDEKNFWERVKEKL